MRRLALAFLVIASWAGARPDPIRYLRLPEVQSLLASFAATGEKLPEFTDAKEWEGWIHERDAAIRGRVDRGIEDATSSLIIFGTGFTTLPRFASAPDAVNAAGDLVPNARARLDAFLQAVDQQDTERFQFVIEFLQRRRVSEDEVKAFLAGNLRRFALEQAGNRRTRKTTDAASTGGAISAQTSLPVDFAIENALRALKSKGAVTGLIRRIAVIGPGLDFTGEPDGFDFCPPQTIQPFAVLEAVLRLGLAQPSEVQITAFDVNPAVVSHLNVAAGKARAGQRYVLQLPRPVTGSWNEAAVAYWQHFGETIGTTATPLTAPGLNLRAVAVKGQYAARVAAEDLNIVTQTLEMAPGRGFDLVVATNVLGYYNPLEQALALNSIGQMMTKGGILLSNNALPAAALPQFDSLGTSVVPIDSHIGVSILALRFR